MSGVDAWPLKSARLTGQQIIIITIIIIIMKKRNEKRL